jgi:NAD(P)H dehydrogenase (quinone)
MRDESDLPRTALPCDSVGMNIAIIYHTKSGNTETVAATIAEGTARIAGVVAKAMSIDSIDRDFVDSARAVIVGFPIYAGSCSWQIKQWIDTTDLKLAGKLGTVFATANHIGGGAEVGELVIITGLLVRGMLVYTAGASQGAPYTHLGAVSIKGGDEAQRDRAVTFGERVARKAIELWGAVDGPAPAAAAE